MKDDVLKLEVELRYSVFEGNDAVIRSAVITNYGDKPLYIEKVLSACLELGYEPHDYITLHGSWARERRIDRQRVGFGCPVLNHHAVYQAIRSILLWLLYQRGQRRKQVMYMQ